MGAKITGAGGQKYRKLLVKQEGRARDTAKILYTATQDCLMYIWKVMSSTGDPYIKINGTATTSNYSAYFKSWVSFNYSDEDIEHHIEMCGSNFIKLYLNKGDYVSLISSNTSYDAVVNYRVLV